MPKKAAKEIQEPKRFTFNESTISTALGLLVIFLTGILLINYFRSANKNTVGETSSTNTENTEVQADKTVEETVSSGLPAEYVIKAGDTLWAISEKAYGTGYNWTLVYEANKSSIANPGIIETGAKITLPKVETPQPVTYKVQAGDSLWSIGVKTCNNGYLWPRIAADNKIANPGLIFSGQELKVICYK
jgi:nucleoid-associated protein YgaU